MDRGQSAKTMTILPVKNYPLYIKRCEEIMVWEIARVQYMYVWEITHVLSIYEYQPSGVTASPGGCPDLKLKMICHKIHTG